MINPTHPDIKCSNCAFFQPVNGSHSHCRFYPPTPVKDNPLAHDWPTVTETEWCGQFMHKDEYIELHKKYLTP